MINGSSALAIPYYGLKGRYAGIPSEYDLLPFYTYVSEIKLDGIQWDKHRLDEDLKNGQHYHANIPVGYGLGSSGALTAATFDRYLIKNRQLSTQELRGIFQEMESFFHGSSSGIDPLVSYLSEGVLIQNNEIEIITPIATDQHLFYLVDTGISRSTSPLVELYHQKYTSPSFRAQIELLTQLNAQAISSYLQQSDELIEVFTEISLIQQEHFTEMIPETMKPIVTEYSLKLCGAGGGGFFLGCCRKEDKENIEARLDATFLGGS